MKLFCSASISSIDEEDDIVQKQKLSITTLLMQSNNAEHNFVINRFEEGITVAELMMDYPGHFVCCPPPMPRHAHLADVDERSADELDLNGKICALPADVELQRGRLYLVLPMSKLNGRFTSEEKAVLSCHLTPKSNSCHITPKISLKKIAMSLAQALKSPSSAKVTPLLSSTVPPPRVINYKDEMLKYGLRLMPDHKNNHCPNPSPSPNPNLSLVNISIEKHSDMLEEKPNLAMFLGTHRNACSKPWMPKLDTIHESRSL